jgi:uncharacterized protein DUF6941
MATAPIVRYMLPCHDWEMDPIRDRLINIVGLLSQIRAEEYASFPVVFPELCIVLVLTECYESGIGRIACVRDEDGGIVFSSREHIMLFDTDPLNVVVTVFRLLDCSFPAPGIYSIQFWFDDQLLHECPLRVR